MSEYDLADVPMSFHKLMIANRGEIAIRIARAAGDAGLATVAIHSADDAQSMHVRAADEAREIPGRGARAYLDIEAVIEAAKATGCDAIHPGYGFLSENAAFARRCIEESIVFVGPSPDALELFGDKARAKALAKQCEVPIIEGTEGPTSLDEARAFLESLGEGGAIMIKAIAGGGGRGMRTVSDASRLEEAYARCQSEAMASFGIGDVYVERLIRNARHIEVQIICDHHGAISHLWERECTIQRRNQKLIEVAPSPSLNDALRMRIIEAAKEMAAVAEYDNLGTFEFLVDNDATTGDKAFAFIEANPRLQVEHTVTEQVLGLDLVQSQLAVAAGATLGSLGLAQGYIPRPRGFAMQLRVNMEVMDELGATKPTGGVLSMFDLPSGPGVRVDTFGYSGYRTSAAFDSLLAKVIVHAAGGNWTDVVHKATRTLREFRIGGVDTNLPFLAAILAHPDFIENRLSTGFIDKHVAALVGEARRAVEEVAEAELVDASDAADDNALALEVVASADVPEGVIAVRAPLQGTIVTIDVGEGDLVRPGQQIAVLESMKMEHLVTAPQGGRVTMVAAAPGVTLMQDEQILYLEPAEVDAHDVTEEEDVDLDHIRSDLAELIERHAITLDENRPASVERRRKTNQRTARENVAHLVDEGSFVEYGSLAIAAQRRRRKVDDLIRNTPADGLISGVATVNAAKFGAEAARCMVISYDYTVLAGTQGHMNHKKIDRMLSLTEQWRLPLVFYAEGGGGRPGDTDRLGMTGLDGPSFVQFARISGLVPVIGVVSGYCFAGNAAMLGCCDVIIATKNASIGMGGPAMIEGGGLGVYHPAEVGPVSFQAPNGVIDILVEDEAEATAAAQKYLSYFQGAVADWKAPDQRLLRRAIPENRLRVYDIRTVIDLLADEGSVLELRRDFGVGMITAFIRIEGRPFGLIANNPKHLGGAIDAPSRRQGRTLPATLRRLRYPDHLALRYAGLHGRSRGGEDRDRAPRRADVRHGRKHHGAVVRRGAAQGLWPRRAGHDRWRLPRLVLHGGMADRRIRRHGPGRLCAARLPQGDGSDRRSARARGILQGQGRGALRQRQGGLDRLGAGDRRGDRPGGDKALDHVGLALGAEAGSEDDAEAAVYRYMVIVSPAPRGGGSSRIARCVAGRGDSLSTNALLVLKDGVSTSSRACVDILSPRPVSHGWRHASRPAPSRGG